MPYVKVKDLDMFYEKMGVGDVVIFLHSAYSRGILAFSSQILDFQRVFTCYFPDIRGHGRTRCESLEWNTPQFANDIVAFMDQLKIERAHLVGYSLGANVGLYVAVNNPDRVTTLTTIGTGGVCVPTGVEEFEVESLIQRGQQDFINQLIDRHNEAHKGNWQEFVRQSAVDWRSYPQLSHEQLSTIGCPSFFITGEHDIFAGEARVKELCSLVKRSRYLVVPGGGHGSHTLREHPVFVNDAILDFLLAHSTSETD